MAGDARLLRIQVGFLEHGFAACCHEETAVLSNAVVLPLAAADTVHGINSGIYCKFHNYTEANMNPFP